MNAKHLFLTLTMLLASITFAWGATATDVLTESGFATTYSLSESTYQDFSSLALTTSARYKGMLRYKPDFLQFKENKSEQEALFASTTSGGLVKSVSVVWDDDEVCSVVVYASNTAFSGTEESGDLESDKTRYVYIGKITYPATSIDVESEGDFRYVGLIGEDDPAVTSISVTWTLETSYNVTMDSGYKKKEGKVVVNSNTATAGGVVASVKEGDLLTIEITPDEDYYLSSFTLGDMEFDFSCMGYIPEEETGTFKILMPAENMTLSVTFEDMPKKKSQSVTIKEEGVTTSSATIMSGLEKTFTFELKYHGSTSPAYTGAVTVTPEDASVFAVTSYSYNSATGTGSFTIKGFTGSSRVVIDAKKTIYVSQKTAYLNITVDPREVALVAENSGNYYAMLHSYDDGKLSAQQIFKGGDTYYYDVAGSSVSDMTWNVMTTSVSDDAFNIQNPEDNKYLQLPKAKLLLEAAAFEWWKDGDNMFTSSTSVYGLNFDTDHFTSATSWDNGVVETVIGDKFRPMTYSTVSGAGIVDSRKLAAGDYGTLCVPFNVASTAGSGATFYTITGKHVSGDNLVGIFISDPVTELEAGHSYIYQIEGGYTSITLQGSSAFVNNADTDPDDGFVGCLPGDGESMTVPGVASRVDGNYGFSKGTLHYVQPGATPTIKKYRAYVKASELEKGDPAPGRRMLMNSDYTGEVTGIDDVVEVVFIDWSKPVYNIMGVQVGEGATGVLIQDGHKFLVQ